MSADRYRVANAQVVADQFRVALSIARERGTLLRAIRSAKWMWEELARTPEQFGESRYYLPNAELHVRIAFVGPLYVLFGYHESARIVFVRKIGYSRRRPEPLRFNP
jgi:hypothetical protein